MLVTMPEKGAPAGGRIRSPQRWVSLKITVDRKLGAVPADKPLCQIIEQQIHDFDGSLLGADELGDESELGAGQSPIVSCGIVVGSPGHFANDTMALGWAGSTSNRRPARSMSGGECYDLAGASFNQRHHVPAPAHERCLHFVPVRAAVVNAGDAGAIAAVVVERRLDHVRVDLDVAHAGGDGAPNVAQLPRLHAAEPA